MIQCVIAEKPSVAREIAAIVGATKKEDGYLSGNNYLVTWAFGHLIALAMPEDYGIKSFVRENLPIIPETFKLIPRQVKDGKEYKPDGGALKQLKIIKDVFEKSDRIINSCDSGREGEAIFRYIYSYLNCNKPVDRLWISSLTDKAIRDGLQNLKPGSDYDNLYQAAKARAEADWACGLNSTQALSVAAGSGVYSLGRVQTPTLAMICKRFLENKNFVSTPFWQIRIQTEKSNVQFHAMSREKYENKEIANEIFQKLKGNDLKVESVETKEVNQEPPLPYDLTALQKQANIKYGFPADKTLSIAQKLYESKLTTYPRTSSSYIPTDVFDEIPELIKSLENHPRFGACAASMENAALNIRCVDSSKISDHHALIITGNNADSITGDEKTVYEMIAGRMLEAFSKKCVKDATTIVLSSKETIFEAKGSVIKQAGWRAVFGEKEETGEEADALPELMQGGTLPVINTEFLEKQTKPKAPHTEATLLGAMESCGQEVIDEAEREAIKDSGVGTPATRAAIIETLFARGYVAREKKSLIPTEKGLLVYETVKDKQIADVAMTGQWENALSQIENGKMPPETFKKAIEVYTRQITNELLNIPKNAFPSVEKRETAESVICPKCKKLQLRFYPKVVKCPDENCGFAVFRSVADKQLTDSQITELVAKGKTGIIKGFKSKAGKSFDAALKIDENLKIIFQFEENKQSKRKK